MKNLEKNDEYLKPYLIKNNTNGYQYDIDKMYEDLNKVNFIKSGNSIIYINNMGCDTKITESELLHGRQFNFEKIPKIFYDNKVINIIKNKDEKCFIYCYIRKYLNPANKHAKRVSLKDKEHVKKLEEELEYNFGNVKIKKLNQIENLLKTNIYVYSCDKNLKIKFLFINLIKIILNYEINMSTFDQKEFDNVNICKYCNYNFKESDNGRKIALTEKVDKYKLRRIIDDFENNNINEETQNNLKQYYNN